MTAVATRKRECEVFADQLEEAFISLAQSIVQGREAIADIERLMSHEHADAYARQLGHTDINSMVKDRYAGALVALKGDKAELNEARTKLIEAGLGHTVRASLLGTARTTERDAAKRIKGGESAPQDHEEIVDAELVPEDESPVGKDGLVVLDDPDNEPERPVREEATPTAWRDFAQACQVFAREHGEVPPTDAELKLVNSRLKKIAKVMMGYNS